MAQLLRVTGVLVARGHFYIVTRREVGIRSSMARGGSNIFGMGLLASGGIASSKIVSEGDLPSIADWARRSPKPVPLFFCVKARTCRSNRGGEEKVASDVERDREPFLSHDRSGRGVCTRSSIFIPIPVRKCIKWIHRFFWRISCWRLGRKNRWISILAWLQSTWEIFFTQGIYQPFSIDFFRHCEWQFVFLLILHQTGM